MKIDISLLEHLQLQPIDSSDDGTVSELDKSMPDEEIDLTHEQDEQELDQAWQAVLDDYKNDPDQLTFSK